MSCRKKPHSENTPCNRFSSKYPRKLMERICGPFRDKNFTMYDFANAVSSVGFTIDVNDSFLLPSKYRRTSLHKAYNRVFDFVKSKSTG